jgi:hypothetical protein
MHLIGRRIRVWAETPSGDTIRLINIPDWDFNWQGTYSFAQLVKIPAGSTLKSEAFYDNTSDNPFNPNFPPQDVELGESTTDEMMLAYFTFTAYQPGDENIVIDSTALTTSTFQLPPKMREKLGITISPNPASESINAIFDLPEAGFYEVGVYNMAGDLMKIVHRNQHFAAGQHTLSVPLQNLPTGGLFLKISSEKVYGVGRFVRID